MSGIKKQTYLEGAAILVVANLLVKVIGALFKIPLASILGEEGFAIFNTAYVMYATMFVVATAGLPVAVSKMVSESVARHNIAETRRILRAALTLLFLIGLAGSLTLFFGAETFAWMVNAPQEVTEAELERISMSRYAIMAISPAIFLVAIVSAFRGYFQGFSNMIPTAMSEVAEALGKLLIGLLLAYLLIPFGVAYASTGAVIGVTAGTLFACIILIVTYLKNKNRMERAIVQDNTSRSRTTRHIFLALLTIAVPITIGAAVSSLTNIIDMLMIRNRLRTIIVTPEIANTLINYYGVENIADYIEIGAQMLSQPADVLYGSYSGFAVSLFNLPPTIVTSLSMSVVPAVAGAYALKNRKQSRLLAESTIRITTLFSLPCAVGLSVLASPILIAVFNNARSQYMLSVLAYAVIFVCLVSVTTAILQATGHVMIPVFNMLVGGIVKIVTNYILIAIPSVNIGGAPFSTLLCYFAIALLNLFFVIKILHPKLTIKGFLVKPAICAAIMGFLVYWIYQLAAKAMDLPALSLALQFLPAEAPVTPVSGSMRLMVILALGLAIAIGALTYLLLLFVTRTITRTDIEMLPKGQKIAFLLERMHLLPPQRSKKIPKSTN